MSDLSKKVRNAIKVLKIAEIALNEKQHNDIIVNEIDGGVQTIDGNHIEVSYSTGKDSDVILYLAQMAGVKHLPIYKATGIDRSGSIKHAREVGAIVIKPKTPFFKLIENGGFPTRRARFCCAALKEYKVLDVAIHGIRKAESVARSKNYQEPQICRMYNKKDHVQVFLPILDWTNEDIKLFIQSENIQCHPHYYDENGCFCVERRVGCICCPLQSAKKLQGEFKQHPRMVKAYIQHALVWWNTHTETSSHKKFPNVYDLFYHNVFCKNYYDYQLKANGLFGKLDCKAFLEDYFSIDLP